MTTRRFLRVGVPGWIVCAALLGAQRRARAQDAGTIHGCVASAPSGSIHPRLEDTFPARGLSGYAAVLEIVIEHGKGETVLPRGLRLGDPSESGDLATDLNTRGFVLPHQDGGAGASLSEPKPADGTSERAKTTLGIPLLLLPPQPGRQQLELPPLPIVVARASGETFTLCTHAHRVTVEDPIASTPHPRPKLNPPPIAQFEEWTSLKRNLLYGALGAAIGALLLFLYRRWASRPIPLPPPPPPRPPWEIALETLHEIRFSGMLQMQRYDAFVDRVNDTLRKYLGDRFGFDGLESTSDEIIGALKSHLPSDARDVVRSFLRDTDLIKFANLVPTADECQKALERGETIVRATMPMATMSLSAAATPDVRHATHAVGDRAVTDPTILDEEKYGPKPGGT